MFATLAALPDDRIDLGAAALLIAADEYPDLERDAYTARLDAMGFELRSRLSAYLRPEEVVEQLSGYLAGEMGFRGNIDAYYDPRNSFLNDVLDRRLGIPITLAVVYVCVGRRADLDVRGVGFPAHFLAKYVAPDGREVVFDPFHGGRLVTDEECTLRLSEASGGTLAFDRRYLAETPPRQILVRMLNNLKQIYAAGQFHRNAARTIGHILELQPTAYGELRDRAACWLALQDLGQARADFQAYLRNVPEAPDAQTVRQALGQIERTLTLMD